MRPQLRPCRERNPVAITPTPGVEYWLDIVFRLKQATPWADAGHEIAWEQFSANQAVPLPAVKTDEIPTLKLAENDQKATVAGRNFTVRIDKNTGWIVSLKQQGTELIHSPLRPDFWRAPTDNDRGNGMPKLRYVRRKARSADEFVLAALNLSHFVQT